MNMNQYQAKIRKFATYPKAAGLAYTVLGLNGEAGEVAEKLKKQIRDREADFDDPDFQDALAKELGDCLWYLAQSATEVGLDLAEIAAMNLAKLSSRADRGVLHGAGDDR